METTERTYSASDVAKAIGLTRSSVQKRLQKLGVQPVVMGHTQNGGYKYRESEIFHVYGERFIPALVPPREVVRRCLRCGRRRKAENYASTHGLCLDCWCEELNKWLIDRRMRLEDATKATLESLKAQGIIDETGA